MLIWEGAPGVRLPYFMICKTNTMIRLSKHHFWEWFKRHHKEFTDLNKKPKKEVAYWLSELNAHLRAYFKFFEYSLALEDKQPSILTVTVKGRAVHFKKVESFVAIAPEMPGWKTSALEDPMPIDFFLGKLIIDTGIHPRELYFSFTSDATGCQAIKVYHPLCTKENKNCILQLANGALYNLLGERTYGMEIGWLEATNLSYADPDDVYKLEELPAFIDARKSSVIVDGSGRLVGV